MSRASPAGTPHVVTVPHTRQGQHAFVSSLRSLAGWLAPVRMYIAAGPLQTSPAAAAAKAKQDLAA